MKRVKDVIIQLCALLFYFSFISTHKILSLKAFSSQHAISSCRLRSRGLSAIPAEIRVVTKLAGLDKVGDCEEHTENDADSCNCNVGDSEERVLAAYYGTGADKDSFCSTILGNIELWIGLAIQEMEIRRKISNMVTYGGRYQGCKYQLASMWYRSSAPTC